MFPVIRGFDVDLDKVKLYVVAPDVNVRAGELTREVASDRGNCDVKVLLLNGDWYVDEGVRVVNKGYI